MDIKEIWNESLKGPMYVYDLFSSPSRRLNIEDFTVEILKNIYRCGNVLKIYAPSDKNHRTSLTILRVTTEFKKGKFHNIPIKTYDDSEFIEKDILILETENTDYKYRQLRFQNSSLY